MRKKIKSTNSNHFKIVIVPLHEDLIGDKFWKVNHEILSLDKTQEYEYSNWDDLPELIKTQFHSHKNEDNLVDTINRVIEVD